MGKNLLKMHNIAYLSLIVLLIIPFFLWNYTKNNIGQDYYPVIVLIAGTLVSLSFFLLFYSIGTSRSRSMQIADTMTNQLKINQESLQMRDHAINSTAEGIVITDPARKDNPIIYANIGFEKLTGYGNNEIIGRNCRFLQGNDKDQSAIFELKKLVEGETEGKVVLRNYRKDGTLFWNELSITPVFDENKNLINFVGVLHDITEIKKKEKELSVGKEELEKTKAATLNIMEDIEATNQDLVQTQEKLKQNVNELRKLDYQKDQFISIAAHELKTPLTSIKGFVDLLRRRDVSENIQLRDKYLGIIYNDTKRLATLITNILELSRMDLGTLKLALQEIKVEELIKEVKDQMDIIIRGKGLESEYKIEPITQLWIDKDKTIQIISNLINNAVHYTEKGKISIEVKKQDDFALFSISDTGVGIPKEHWGKLFTRFYQVDSPLTRKIGGSGLGLSISKGFVEAMGGKIWFNSEMGKGTTFSFTIPLKKLDLQDEVNMFNNGLSRKS